MAARSQGYLEETQSEIRKGLGSNNWVVSGAHTATGKPLLANDTHLELSIPPIWYEIHLSAPGCNAKGIHAPRRATRSSLATTIASPGALPITAPMCRTYT